MNLIREILCKCLLVWCCTACSSPTINFFIRPYPFLNSIQASKIPAELSGIFVTYAGQLDASRLNGQVKFINKQNDQNFSLFITSKVTPILGPGNTMIHWEIERGTPASLFHIKREFDETSKVNFWNIHAGKLPEDGIIPLSTILVFADPYDIYVPEGITATSAGINLMLPDIYVKRGMDKMAHALYVLGIKNFFSTINLEFKKGDAHYASQILGP